LSDPLIGRTLLHYHIVDKIGQGGMGAVYLAHDPRLQRNVAVKVLASSAADERRRERFVREARAASALNHPHIVTIHDIARDGEIDFIVMEWVDGRPLDALIPRHGLPIRDAVEYALQIADAVAAAHRAGIVHRDLKPANIIATGSGRIRVLDFGLAKLTAAGDSEDGLAETRVGLTQAGTVLGTFAYMAPEQAIGGAVDHRADIFSFAAMLYEMLSGEPPFAGASAPAIIHALHYTEPRPLAELRPDVPPALAQTVHAALAKEPSHRTPSMETMYGELKAVAAWLDAAPRTPAPAGAHAVRPAPSSTTDSTAEPSQRPPAIGSERASLAVLPFTSLSADKEDGYLAAGITAELVSALSGIPDLRVASHLAAARFQGSSVDLPAVASALNIRYILTGSVRHAKNRIRVSSDLTDAVSGVMLWSKTYQGGLEDIFEVQEDIARQIVSALGGELIRAGSERASRTAPENLDAWGLVRRAYHFWNHAWTPEGVEDALNLLRRAVQLDPSYAAARAFLALYLIQRTVNFISPNPEADMREALAAASTAIELAPRDPEVLENVGLVYFNTGQYENAVATLKRAVQIAPFNLVAWGYLGLSHAWSGEEDEVEEGRKILDRLLHTAPDHPSVPYWLYFKTAALTRQGRFADAADAAHQSTERQPYFYIARIAYANALGALGQTDRARAEIDRVLATNPTITPEIYIQSVYLLARVDARAANHLAGLRAAGWIAS
jgi:non-specific serine/threonine protein kinase